MVKLFGPKLAHIGELLSIVDLLSFRELFENWSYNIVSVGSSSTRSVARM